MPLRELDPTVAVSALLAERAPMLVGVRHHSPALAASMPGLLDSLDPTVLMIELPADLGAWLPWLSSKELVAPVALSATGDDGELFFYPFADFSPELAALRWARERGVRATAIDRPVSARSIRAPDESPRAGRLLARLPQDEDCDMWDAMVESRAPGSTPEELRRAALSFGWLLRADSLQGGGIPREDAAREAHMRAHVDRELEAGERPCAVIGAFHAAALVRRPIKEDPPPAPVNELVSAVHPRVGALVPYDFDLLDSRSGYPAGIRDPMLMQRSFELLSRGSSLEEALPEIVVEIARDMRARGHVASFSDLREAVRVASDLARLRGLPASGRRELLEGIETAMVQGERTGRGRVLARSMSAVLVGHRRGRLPEDAPRSGLLVAVNGLLEALSLPGPEASREPKELTLDPERSRLDRRRAVLLGQLEVCGVPYAERRRRGVSGARGDIDNLTMRVSVRYTPETAARLEIAGIFGATPAVAAEGTLRRSLASLEREEVGLAAGWLAHLSRAARAGLGPLVGELLDRMHSTFLSCASLPEIAEAIGALARIEQGHVAGLPREAEPDNVASFTRDLAPSQEDLLLAALRTLEGVVGSESEDVVRAFGELLALFAERSSMTLRHAVTQFASRGGPLMRGAGLAARALLGLDPPELFFATFVSLFDQGADDVTAARERTATLRGALLLAGPIFEGDPRFTEEILAAVDRPEDAAFLRRLPSLRGGFDVLSAGDRQRLLDVLGEALTSVDLSFSPEVLAACAQADQAGAAALHALGLSPPTSPLAAVTSAPGRPGFREDHRISLHDRLRLLLGREQKKLDAGSARFARALDELYGHGHGESSREGGTEEGYPTAREWGDELMDLFGEHVREEVLGRAAEHGQGAALALLDPEQVTPSIELLEQVLSLKGGLSEREMDHLKRLARRVVDALVQELATRTRPALVGLATPRASRRRGGPLDLRRTIQRNLATAVAGQDGFRLQPREFTFRTRARKSLDWRVVLVVDVSGSMEASVIHSAMMAAIVGGLPAVTAHFVAVSDRVVDLSEHAADPLELLLSVRIGGGTLLAKGLRYARSLLTVPARSLIVLVSDFEEGGSVGELLSEVRALKDSGATPLGLAVLGDRGAPRYHRAIAEQVVAAGMPVAALTPLELARWIGDRIRGRDA